MGFLQDNLVPFFKERTLRFLEQRQEAENIYNFRFEKNADLVWKAGQYGLFGITHKKIKNAVRPFSVSSAPAENVVQITTRIDDNPSEFKQALLELNQGMEASLRGPVGPFYLQGSGPVLLIAGGIGITPFRSMLKQVEADGNADDKQIHLLYLDSSKSYLFQDELDQIAKRTSIGITTLDSREDLHREIDQYTASAKNSEYFIAGPKSMAEAVSDYLQNKQISKRNIKKDAFFGY